MSVQLFQKASNLLVTFLLLGLKFILSKRHNFLQIFSLNKGPIYANNDEDFLQSIDKNGLEVDFSVESVDLEVRHLFSSEIPKNISIVIKRNLCSYLFL